MIGRQDKGACLWNSIAPFNMDIRQQSKEKTH
jgi:hypothetical protein